MGGIIDAKTANWTTLWPSKVSSFASECEEGSAKCSIEDSGSIGGSDKGCIVACDNFAAETSNKVCIAGSIVGSDTVPGEGTVEVYIDGSGKISDKFSDTGLYSGCSAGSGKISDKVTNKGLDTGCSAGSDKIPDKISDKVTNNGFDDDGCIDGCC